MNTRYWEMLLHSVYSCIHFNIFINFAVVFAVYWNYFFFRYWLISDLVLNSSFPIIYNAFSRAIFKIVQVIFISCNQSLHDVISPYKKAENCINISNYKMKYDKMSAYGYFNKQTKLQLFLCCYINKSKYTFMKKLQ